MTKNMGTIDRILRFTVAIIIGILYYLNFINGTVGIVLLILAGVFLLTSFVSFCPLYTPFGINTCKIKNK